MYFKNKKNKGFTIIELLIVVAIMNLLASISFAALMPARKKSQDSVQIVYVNALLHALDEYQDDHNGYYPSIFATNLPAGNGRAYRTIDPEWESQLMPALRPYMMIDTTTPPGEIWITVNPAGRDPYTYVNYWPGVCMFPGSSAVIGYLKGSARNTDSLYKYPFPWDGSPDPDANNIYLKASGDYMTWYSGYTGGYHSC